MTNQNTERGEYRASGEGRGAASEDLNWGSARTDYGEHAYGGRLDKKGMESGADRRMDWGMDREMDRRMDRETGGDYRRSRRFKSFRRGGEKGDWANRGLMLLGGTVVGVGVGVGIGLGVGLAAMYMFDPKEGKNRRETARGKITDATHKAGDFIGKRTHDLRDRAKGMMAGARRQSYAGQSADALTSGEGAMTHRAV